MRFRHDHYHHTDSEGADPRLDQILRAIHTFEVRMAKTLAEMKAELQQRLDANLVEVEKNTAVDQSIEILVQSIVAQNQAFRQQLVDAMATIAAGADASVLQPIIDAFSAQTEVLAASTTKAAALVVANTPAA